MFGMLDYRANKLFLVFWIIPFFLSVLITLFGIPFSAYHIAYSYADNLILQFLIAIICIFIFELIFSFLFNLLIKTPIEFFFKLFVDIVPHNNRTQEEAERVAFGGDTEMFAILLTHHPKDWNEDELNRILSYPTIGRFFFGEIIRDRLFAIREHFTNNEGEYYDELSILDYVKEHYKPSFWERNVSDPIRRRSIIALFFLCYLLIYNPAGL